MANLRQRVFARWTGRLHQWPTTEVTLLSQEAKVDVRDLVDVVDAAEVDAAEVDAADAADVVDAEHAGLAELAGLAGLAELAALAGLAVVVELAEAVLQAVVPVLVEDAGPAQPVEPAAFLAEVSALVHLEDHLLPHHRSHIFLRHKRQGQIGRCHALLLLPRRSGFHPTQAPEQLLACPKLPRAKRAHLQAGRRAVKAAQVRRERKKQRKIKRTKKEEKKEVVPEGSPKAARAG